MTLNRFNKGDSAQMKVTIGNVSYIIDVEVLSVNIFDNNYIYKVKSKSFIKGVVFDILEEGLDQANTY